MKIAIIGPYPPPYGGISIHVQRLGALLNQEGFDTEIFPNISARKWLADARGNWFNYDVLHFHDVSWMNRVGIGLMGLMGFGVVLTIHGDSLKNQLTHAGWFKRSLLGFSMRHITHIVGVKTEIRDLLLSLGVEPSQVSVVNAYLPPVFEQAHPVPDSIGEFVDSHYPLIVANGFGAIPLSEETDLYGLEMIIDLCARLIGIHPKVGCLVFLAQIGDQNCYDELVSKVSQLGLNEQFRFIIGENLAPTLKRATIFVRPTFEDGYGISVTESLYFGVPALASDVCEREPGALIFKCGDAQDFYRCTQQVLGDYETAKKNALEAKPLSAYEQLLAIYQNIANIR